MVGDDFATAPGRGVTVDAARGADLGAGRYRHRASRVRRPPCQTSKLVTQLQAARISFTGVTSIDKAATQTVPAGNPGTWNTLAAPNAIVLQKSSETVANGQRLAFPASSVTVLQITAK